MQIPLPAILVVANSFMNSLLMGLLAACVFYSTDITKTKADLLRYQICK